MFNRQTQIKVVDRIDHLSKSLTAEQVEALYQCEKSDLMLESVTLEELENTLLFQCEPVPQMMLEAFKSKASQLAIRVKKFANQLERKTPNLTCGEVEIGKPRKSGAVAVQIAKIPLSDGQSVSIAFHAPDNDPLKINADDTLIAFRFLLNSRDVTHTVAPKGGQDVSLKEATTKLGTLAEKNSDKFSAAQAKKNADAAALQSAQEKAQELEEEAAQLNTEATNLEIQGDEVDARIKRLKTQISTQNEIQDDLRKQLAKKQASVAAVEPASASDEPASATVEPESNGSIDPVVALFRDPKLKAASDLALKVEGGKRAFSTLGTIADIDVNGAKGMDRALFVSNFAGRIKTLHKNGNQEAVDAILTMVAAYNDVAPKAAVTARNGIWKLGNIHSVEALSNLGNSSNNVANTDFDPNADYSAYRYSKNIEGIIGIISDLNSNLMDSKDAASIIYDIAESSNDTSLPDSAIEIASNAIHSKDSFVKSKVINILSEIANNLIGYGVLQEQPPEEKVVIDNDLFWYGLRARPFSIGAVPSIHQSAILTAEQAQVAFPSVGNSVRHGAVGYSEQLSENEVSSFEFVPLFEDVAAISDEDVQYTARELILGWLDSKGLSKVEQNEINTLIQAVSLGDINSIFAKVIRELPVFKNRKSDKEEYNNFLAELEAIDSDMLKRVVDEMGIVAVKGDDADEATKGKTDEEKQLLALDPNEFTFGAIYDAEGAQDGKTISSRIRAFITQGKKQGKLPKDLKISVKNQRGGLSTAIIMRLTDLPDSIRVNSDAALQSAIDNDGRLAYGQSRYSDELTNLIKYVEAYVNQFNHISGDAYGDYGYDHAVYGNHLQLDAVFSNERWVQELESFTELHQGGDEPEAPELDVNGIRDSLDADSALQLEQLEEFTNFKIQLGKQEITLPNGKSKSKTINDESDVEWVIDDFHEHLVTALEEKAVAQLESLTNWQSERVYYGQDFQGQININSSIHTNKKDSDSIDGLYGRSNLTASIGTRFVRIYPVAKSGEFKFAAYSNDSSKHLGDFTDHSELEMLCIFALELTDQQPAQESSEEMEYTDKLKVIRDYTGVASQEQLEQYQADLEAAYAYFQESGTYAENESLMEAAFASYVALQDQVAA